MCATDVMDETCVKNAGRKGLWEARVGRGDAGGSWLKENLDAKGRVRTKEE